ncbi:BnaA06g23360D [Brassica napus]|uniref:BnaA06g23360D protein n=1 Tax=Brassica napus TaxID=3708 RepID=A0A078HYX9_BRANA|nr:BnaA06g23360D [Brassica napus]
MASRREVRCRCGRWMSAQPGVSSIQCSTCHTVTQLSSSLVDIARGANRQQQIMAQPPPRRQHKQQQQQPQQQIMAQPPPPPKLLEPLPSPFGKKRAVICGLDYKGKSYSLEGCISDAKSMRTFLVKQMGFPIDSILMLTEDEASPQRIPTKKNIRKAMRWLVEGNRARDSLVFHYSGHGSQQKDYNGDEVDGQDEALAPLDHETEGKIIDDEINKTLVRPLVHGAKLHAVIDACNSGTVLDLPSVCRMERNGFYEWERQTSGRTYKGTNGGTAICLSACDDHEASGYTPVFTGKNAGAMTYSFIKAVKTAGPAPTYGHLLNLMCSAIREAQSRLARDENYTSPEETAEPLLTSSEEFDIYATKFVL